MLDALAWQPLDPPDPEVLAAAELPHATHEGFLDLAGARLRVVRLSDGQRIIDADDLSNFLELGRVSQP